MLTPADDRLADRSPPVVDDRRDALLERRALARPLPSQPSLVTSVRCGGGLKFGVFAYKRRSRGVRDTQAMR